MKVDLAFQWQNIRGVGQTHTVTVRNLLLSRPSPAELLLHFVHVPQISPDKVGLALRQALARPRAGRDRDRPRAESFAAGNVVPGIANDVDLFRTKFEPGMGHGAANGT